MGDVAVHVTETAKENCKDQVQDFVTCANSLVDVMSTEKAISIEFKIQIKQGKIVKARLQQLQTKLAPKQPPPKTLAALQASVLELLEPIPDAEDKSLLTHKEFETIQNCLHTKTISNNVVAATAEFKNSIKNIKKQTAAEVIRGTVLKPKGVHARCLFRDGGGVTALHHLNTYSITFKLKHREKA